tara:strand:+ start:638 stop:1738 length:1101 start_codon:yes stop_codon:yes gene_type:complete
MKKIRVYLQYPWRFFPDSPYYKYLLENIPKNIEYLNTEKQKGVITNSGKFLFSKHLKWKIREMIYLFKISMINAHFTKSKKDYDLIHCAHCLSKNKDKPWVADFEGIWQFYVGNKNYSLKEKIKKILLSKECKKIIAWTINIKESILKEFPEIKNKIEVVYPAIPMPKIKRKKHNNINLLFVARYFHGKGGLHALEAIDQLTKKYKNVQGIFISEIPEYILKKYSKNPKIKFYELMSQENLFKKIFTMSDIFVYPGYRDSFGFSILESMSFGIPIVTVNGFSRKELIENDKTGFVLDFNRIISRTEMRRHSEEIVKKIVDKTEILIKDKKLREKMSKNCIELIKNGKFSIKERNKKLGKIYEEALK